MDMGLGVKQIIEEVKYRIKEEANKPFVVSVMGQTGVGKSSLINALFNTDLKTDPVRPCTTEVERVKVKGESGYELWFYDLPGIGESTKADANYLEKYKQKLIESDIVVWTIHADNRSLTFDIEALNRILNAVDEPMRSQLMSKITFVLTKVDLLTPPYWILATMGDYGVFAPSKATKSLLEQKMSYYQEAFLLQYKNLLVSQTYNDGRFDIFLPNLLHYDENTIYYHGFLNARKLGEFIQKWPEHEEVFNRLYDNYQIIPCSSLFRYNLSQLMLVIVNKLGKSSIHRFKNFYTDEEMNRVPIHKAKTFCNLIVVDGIKEELLFNLSNETI